MKTRIMYVEDKSTNGLFGPARIGRVMLFNKGKKLEYGGRTFASLNGAGFKSNYVDVYSGDYFWISGCKKDGTDALYSTTVEIDEEVCLEYWTEIRKQPQKATVQRLKMPGKYAK